ncbi:MAG TPA: hypothetical protein VGR26_18715, partial [Acidimicrobiales bacterium]|nr:hypothetical protein [Acidimicrobiales bacterium]
GYAFASVSRYAYDDAFIVARYVRHIVDGHGWTFNIDQAWNAATSPLHVLLASAVAALGVDPHVAARLVPLTGLAVGVTMLAWELDRESRTAVAFALPVVVFALAPLRWTSGLETGLFVGLLLAFTALELRGKQSWAVVGLVVLARPDGAALLVVKLAMEWWRHRRPPVRGFLTVGVVVAPWLLFSFWQFGSLVPDSVANKTTQAASGIWPVYGSTLWQQVDAAFAPGLWVLVVPLAAIGMASAYERWGTGAVAAFLVVIGQHALYFLSGAPDYPWYYAPLLSFVAVYAVLGLGDITRLVPAHRGGAVAVVAGVLLVIGVVTRPVDTTASEQTSAAYEDAADLIVDSGAESLAVTEVGAWLRTSAGSSVRGYHRPRQP